MKRKRLVHVDVFVCVGQGPSPQEPIQGIVKLFDTYRIVMLGEMHECREEHALLRKLVAAPGFSQRVNDIVMEFGNARYQDIVDRYITGENVPIERVQGAWQDTVAAIGPISPVYGEFYAAVRTVNKSLPKQQRLRVLLGDPPIDWSHVTSPEDLALFYGGGGSTFRDEFYASVVRYQVLAKKRKALLIMGSGHLRRSGSSSGRPPLIENELLSASVKPYVIVPGSNMVRGYDDLDPRFDQWPAPWLMELNGSWIGSLPAQTPRALALMGTLGQMADAYLYLGPRDSLTAAKTWRSDLQGTGYGRESLRRLSIRFQSSPDTETSRIRRRDQAL